jgi:error-prone DNA polymerase
MIGIDTAKSTFQLRGADADGTAAPKRKLQRGELLAFFEKQQRCTVVMEPCGSAHHWARVLGRLGYKVRLIALEAVRLFVKRGKKNDAADAAAICAAAMCPDVKSVADEERKAAGCAHFALGTFPACQAADDVNQRDAGPGSRVRPFQPKGKWKLKELAALISSHDAGSTAALSAVRHRARARSCCRFRGGQVGRLQIRQCSA